MHFCKLSSEPFYSIKLKCPFGGIYRRVFSNGQIQSTGNKLRMSAANRCGSNVVRCPSLTRDRAVYNLVTYTHSEQHLNVFDKTESPKLATSAYEPSDMLQKLCRRRTGHLGLSRPIRIVRSRPIRMLGRDQSRLNRLIMISTSPQLAQRSQSQPGNLILTRLNCNRKCTVRHLHWAVNGRALSSLRCEMPKTFAGCS